MLFAVRKVTAEKGSFAGHPIHSNSSTPMSIKRLLALSALLFLLPFQPVCADNAAPSYVALADAPTVTVDWSRGDTQSVTLGGNRTLAFFHGQKGGKYLLILKQDAHGSRTVTWPSSVHWPGANGPTLTTGANKTDYIRFFYNGVTYDMLAISQGY
jgi:hypothetical protein